ncbi:aminoglycoside phosphotransferase family protein [Phyllobacterium sp. YR531]|uniref:aminoglycoside phosphotransferase family protein n=1 Tax=Phyllobacterium sp. YR531 TaxID=1144343 RepID=UPI00026F7E67|nr:aminoglycoside phosphotransferase family protein [Phyllobacterium sp. YR531]EJN04628.1 putative aminoglycoside phosphotransferase [Phyllobacterium sp. YR531]
MCASNSSAETINIDQSLVRRLIAAQFPQWADLAIKPVEFGGWDNRTFHLGDHMTVRLPSAKHYAEQVEKEQFWLPKLARNLPLPIPEPLGLGKPGEGYPWHWSIYRWIDGGTAKFERIADLVQFARALARFLKALQAIDSAGGPLPGQHNFFRGGELAVYDEQTQQALKTLEGRIDTHIAREIWERALKSEWQNPPVWFHGDVSWGNLLTSKGELSAVIDFGTSGIGDPACDLVIAWTMFRGESREMFRQELTLDDATWARARGWALWKAMIILAGMAGTNSPGGGSSRRVIDEIIADHKFQR